MPLVNVPGVGQVNFPDTMSREEIIEAIERDILPGRSGITQQAPAPSQMEPVPERGLFGTIGARVADVGGSLVSGAGSVATGVGGLGGILGVTGYDNVLTRLGRRGAEFGAELMSPELRNQRRALADAMKEAEDRGLAAEAGTALSMLATNPGLLASMAVEQIPAFILSGGVGRAATAVGQLGARGAARAGTTAVDRAGQAGAIGTAAGLQTGGIADQTYREVMGLPEETINSSPNYQQLLQSMSPAEARETIANRAAREAGVLGGGISVAAMTALPSAEKALFTRGISQSAVRRALGVGTAEAVSEGIEEGGGEFGQNLAIQRQADPERDLLRGVGGAAATGAVLGGVMGAGVGALQRPADPRTGERLDVQQAIADIVAGREPEPQAPGLLPRETRIETPVGDLTRYQLSQYMERMLPGLMQSSPELASMMSYARDENDRLDIFRDFLAERQEGLARGRQGAEVGRIREEIATSPQTRSAFEIAAAREGRAAPGAADLRAGAPAAASPRLVLNPSFDRKTGRLTAGEAITRVGEISPDGNLTVYVERPVNGRLTEVPVRANQDQIYSIPMLESARMTQEAAQVRVGPEQVAGRRGAGVDPYGLSMSPRRVTDRTTGTLGGLPAAEPRQPEVPAPQAQTELPVQPQARTEPPSIIPPVEPVSQANAERPTQAETFNIPIGRQFTVSTPDGSMSVDVVPEVVDLFSLTPATGGLQNRMIENPANQQTINNIANTPDFGRLGTSPYSDRGAPIVGPDNVIEIGNHRVEGLKRGAENNPEAFQSYVKALNDAGYNTAGMRFPVLIRRRVGELSPEQRQDFTRLSNSEANQVLSDLEVARQDASRLTPELLAKFDGEVSGGVRAAKNMAFVREFMAQITTPSERTRLVTPEGGISDAFADRLEKALFASAYNDIGLIKRAVESGDDDSKSITGGMIEATGAMQELRRGIETGRIRPEFGIVDALVKAADRIRAGKANGLVPGDILATEDMLNPIPPLERELVKLLSNDNLNKIASKSAIGKRLKAFVEEAKTQTTDADLVGGERRITPEEAAVAARNPGQASMFSARRVAAAEAQAAPEPEEAAPNQDKARQIVNKYLAELRAMGRQGRLIANSLENLLRDRTMNANQIYQAFMVGETLAKTLPSKADYQIRFLQDLIVDNEQAGAASGSRVGERAQGRVIYPTNSLPGFIELSLAEDMLPLLRETAAHEAFHVLQSYFSSYDANFADRINRFFKDGMTVADLEPSIKRRLQGVRIPGQKISYYDALVESLGDAALSAKEAQAYAFGSLIDAANRGQKVTALIPSFQRFITFARDFFNRMKRGLTGDGFTAPADILTQAQQRGAALEQRAPVVERAEAFSARKPLNATYGAVSKELSGPIVYQDPYVALIEATDGNGNPIYIGTKASGVRTAGDISQYTGKLFNGEEVNVLLNERNKRVAEVARIVTQNPKGPFKQGNVAFDESFPENLRGFSEGILRELGLSNEKVFFTTFKGALEPDFNERNGLFGDYYGIKSMGFYQQKYPTVYGLAKNRMDGKYRAIAINDSKRLSVQIETLAHEIGHVFDYAALSKASDQTYREIEKSFSEWMRKNDRKSGKEYIRLLRTPVVGKEFERKVPEGVTGRDLGQYSRSFSEWFADQVARWSLTSEPAKTLIGRFFQRIAAAYRKIVNAMGAAGLPDQTVAKFIESHRDRENIQIPPPPNVKTKKPIQTSFDFSARRVPEYAARAAAQPAPKDFFEAAKAKVNKPSVFDRALAVLLDKKKGETIGQAFARTSINRAAPLYNLDEIAKAGGYTGRSAAKAMELSLQNTGRMAQLLTSGMGRIDPKTGAIKFRNDVKPLFEIMEGAKLKTEQLKDEFQAYLAALRERDLRARNRQGFFNTTDAQVKDWITKSEAAHPEWKTAAAELDKLNSALVDWALDTGLVTKQQSTTLRDVFYTPFYRLIDRDSIEDPTRSITPRIGESFTNVASAINREMKGGTKPLGDLYENILRNADSIMKAGLKNLAMRQAAETMEFAKLGKKTTVKDPDNTITYKVDGKDVLFEVEDAALFSALAGMPRTMQSGIYDTMAKLAGFFRDMVTIAPSFMLANLWRGKVSAYGQEGQPFMTNTFAGLRDALNASSSLRNFQLQTGFGGMEYGMGERDMASAFDNKMTDEGITKALMKGNAWGAIRQAFGKMQELSEATEMAERIKLAENLMKKGMSKEDAEFQAYLLAPYSRRGTGQGWVGSTLQFLMPLVPFLNAKLQTTYRLFENEKGDKQKLWTLGIPQQIFLRGLVVTAFSLMAYAANLADDEEKWDSLPSHMKLNYDIIPFMGNYITLPRAFEIGQVFGALPIFALDAIRRGEGKDLAGALVEVGLNTFWMNPTPKAIDPIFAVWTNYDFFRGKPLETLAEQNLPVAERVNRSTTSVGKGLSEAVNVVFGRDVLSPIRAQALLDGYTGTLGVTLMSGFDSALAAAGAIPGKPAGAFGSLSGAANLVGLNRFYREDATMVSRFVGDFYKIKEMTDQLVRSQNLARETRDFNRLEELRGEAGLPLQLRAQVSRASDQISDLNKRITRIERSMDMDGVAKTEALEPLIRRRDQIAKTVVDRARSIGAF
jgi:hypothetical protein